MRNVLKAFTLVEILVVIAIIGVLAAILFVALAPARERARQSVCISNLHQIGIALSLYRKDYDGADAAIGVPMTAAQLGLPQTLQENDNFMHSKYILDHHILQCPDAIYTNKCGFDFNNHFNCDSDYAYTFTFWGDDSVLPPYAQFRTLVSKHGDNVIIVYDNYYNKVDKCMNLISWEPPLPGCQDPKDPYGLAKYLQGFPRWTRKLEIVLHLNQSVTRFNAPIISDSTMWY